MKGKYFRPREIEAIVAGRKVVFREVIKPQPKGCTVAVVPSMSSSHWQSRWPVDLRTLYPNSEPTTMIGDIHRSPYQVGETVYIKEAIHRFNLVYASYSRDASPVMFMQSANRFHWRWAKDTLSPMFLPHEAARYFLKITDLRAERLQEISIDDLKAEGLSWENRFGVDFEWRLVTYVLTNDFKQIWDSINKDYPWESNPWVFRYEFEFSS